MYRIVSGLLAVGLMLGACAGEPPEVPLGPDGLPDLVLATGRGLYGEHCASCHGRSGGGGQGPQLSAGVVIANYPNISDQVAVIADGSGSMPSFAKRLSQADLEAVTRYTREVLS